MTVKIY